MLGRLINKIPEKYRFLGFLVITSLTGVTLILIAVYNASKELEIIHEVENLHRFAAAQLSGKHPDATNYQNLLALPAPDYQVLIVRDNEVLPDSLKDTGPDWDIQLATLNESRVNEQGGYIEFDDQLLTWTLLPIANNDTQLLILHRFSSTGIATLKLVYLKRLLVPAIFYVWLMVWVAFIMRFLTNKLSQQKQAMEEMALHDALTGLPNRYLLTDRINKILDKAKRKKSHFALVMIDLDGFKKVNDTFGHAVGDEILKEVARRLSACLRPHDTACRVGGDEFILLLDDMESESSLDICERVSIEIAKSIIIQGAQINIGSSIGIVNYSEHCDDPETLIHKADQAMYAIKAKGGGILLYDEIFVDKHEESSLHNHTTVLKNANYPATE